MALTVVENRDDPATTIDESEENLRRLRIAAEQWNARCGAMEGRIPQLVIGPSNPGATDPFPISVEFLSASQMDKICSTARACACNVTEFDEVTNEAYAGRMFLHTTGEGCEAHGDISHINTMMHEMGHAFGLTHEGRPPPGCSSNVMGLNHDFIHFLRIPFPEDCQLVEQANPPDPCDGDPTSCYEPPWGNDLDVCQIDPSLPGCHEPVPQPFPGCAHDVTCVSVDETGAGGGLAVCDPGNPFSILFWTGILRAAGGTGSNGNTIVEETCTHHWDCPETTGITGPTRAVQGAGPWITFANPRQGDTVSGTIPIGFMLNEAERGGEVVAVLVDHQPVTLVGSFANSEAQGLCDVALGSDPTCPDVGFGGLLDTRAFPDGVHRLQVLAKKRDPLLPFLSWHEIEIEIRNQTQPPRPDLFVVQNFGEHLEVPHGGSYSFGRRDLADLPLVAPFLLCNLGNDRLSISNLSTVVTGSAFGRGPGPSGTIDAQRCSTLEVRFDTTTAGPHTGTVRIETNDPDESPYVFTLSGESLAPHTPQPVLLARPMTGTTPGLPIAPGSTLTLATSSTGTPTSVRVQLRNTGDATLQLHNATAMVTGTCFSQVEAPPSSLGPHGGTAYLRVRLHCNEPGTHTGTVRVQTNDPALPGSGTLTFAVEGTLLDPDPGPAPKLEVVRMAGGVPTTPVTPGDIVAFPHVSPGSPTSVRFALANTGEGPLVLAGPGQLVSGACFSQIETPVTPIEVGGTSYLRVRFQCGPTGSHLGTVDIETNDPMLSNGAFAFELSGTVPP